MTKSTNLVFTNGTETVRLILGVPDKSENRREYDALCDEGFAKNGLHPPVICAAAPDCLIEDDVCVVLERMAAPYSDRRGDWPKGLEGWWRSIEKEGVEIGETRAFCTNGLSISATGDATPMTGLRIRED